MENLQQVLKIFQNTETEEILSDHPNTQKVKIQPQKKTTGYIPSRHRLKIPQLNTCE